MVRQSAVVVLAAVVLIAAMNEGVLAQGRGGRGFGGAPGVRSAPVAPAAPGVRAPATPRGTFNRPFQGNINRPNHGAFVPGIGVVPGVTVVRPRSRIVYPQPFVPYAGFYSPYIWSTPIYTAPAYSEPAYVAPTTDQNTADLAYQVQRLSQEIEQLRQDQSVAATPQLMPQVVPPPQPYTAPESPTMPVVLIFRDGRRMTIQNYAVVGQTLWVLDERTSTKILISDLDLDATERANAGQGVRLPLPKR